MSTIGKKRKLEDTDISPDGDKPTKQQKLMREEKENEENEEFEKEDKKDEILDIESKNKLRNQLEYYFGDSNLSLDSHILNTSAMDINGGYFPISGLLRFKMIESMIGSITNSIDILIKIIESSSKLQLNKSKDGVRRHPDLGDPPSKQDIYKRTIFGKGFHPMIKLNDLRNFWENVTMEFIKDSSKMLSVRTIKDRFAVGIAEDNQEKIVKRFKGSCSVEFATIELAEEFSKMTFNLDGRTIRCGMYNNYWTDDFEWVIKQKYYQFESNRVLCIVNIANHATWCDVKNWISNALYSNKNNKKEHINKCEYVYKEINTGKAYARFSTNSDINRCVGLIKKKPLLGIKTKVIILNDKQSMKIWKKIAKKPCNANKDIQITMKKREKIKYYQNEQDQDEDIDININPKKHKLENPESPQPAKKQKTC